MFTWRIWKTAVFLGECKYRVDNVDMSVLKSIVAGLDQMWTWKWVHGSNAKCGQKVIAVTQTGRSGGVVG
ncbi:hypothetical protein PI125_g3248 [Phytophthora idaei]|nr:hypothetical protein PI125_g3248 [Phytophthora idaei]